jgi:ABC-2 type transport system ATP-binding protein
MRQTILRLHRELRLTILLSSHFLNEVEQICTRIAVLNQGRMVFEGTLAATKQCEDWIRLRTGDFGLAVKELRQAQMITHERDGNLISLSPGTGTEQVVRLLVERGMPVYEIAPVEPTLEDFYLTLMNGQKVVK